ncbi:MAG: 16S rRNA processing protein RimM [Chitinophagaceae bacterium]
MEYFKIGKLVATYGFKGEMVLKHEFGKKTSLKGLQHIFIEEKRNSFLPWFVESAKIKSEEEVYVKLEGIDTKEKASKLKTKEVWVTEADMKKFTAKSAPLSLLGYTIMNEKKEVGSIAEIIEQPHQLLCKVEIQNKEVLIPLNESTIKKINHKKKQVIVELPEGLLEIYFEP